MTDPVSKIEGMQVEQTICLDISDEFELKFPKLSWAELKRFPAESSLARALQFSSWNRADNMYVNK